MSLESHSQGPGAHASTSEPEHDGGPLRLAQSAGTPTPPDPTRVAGVVHAEGVEYGYGVGSPVLRGVDLEIGVGEIVGIVGPVGAGKSTLLRILAGDLRPAAGEVTLPPRRSSGGRVMVGYAAREGAHFEALSGWDNAMFFARAGGMRLRDAEAAVTELMEVLQLDDLAHAPVTEYSPDVRHRLLLVEALAHRPALSVLDDPFHGLELDTREALIHELRVRSAQRGTVVVASEDLTLIPELVDRLLFMHEGRIVAGGRVAELLGGVGSATRVDVELERRPQHFDPRFRPGIAVVSDGDPYILDLTPGRATVSEALAALDAAGAHVRSANVHEADLAEVFRRATGVELQS